MIPGSSEQRPRPTDPVQLSDQAANLVQEKLGAGEEILHVYNTDMLMTGQYGTEWLVLTPKQVMAVRENEITALPLVSMENISVIDFQGNSILRVIAEHQAYDLVRFTRTLANNFAGVPLLMEELAQRAAHDDRVLVDRSERWKAKSRHTHRCPKCGGVIPRRHRVCLACLNKRKLLVRLTSYVVPHMRLAITASILLVVTTVIGLLSPLIMRSIMDSVLVPATQAVMQGNEVVAVIAEGSANSNDILARLLSPLAQPGTFSLLALLCALLFFSHTTAAALEAWRHFIISRLGQVITFTIRNHMYAHLQKLSLSYFTREDTGRIMQRVTNDVRRLQDFLSNGLQDVVQDIIKLASIVTMLLMMSPKLTLMIMIPTPFLIITTIWFSRKLRRVYMALWKRYDGVSSILADTIPGMRVVKAFAQEEREVARFEERSSDLLSGELGAAKINSVYGPLMGTITYIPTVMIWLLGGMRVMDGTLSIGDLTAFNVYMQQFYQPVRNLCNLNRRFQQTASSAERVFDVLDTEPEVQDGVTLPAMPPLKGRVEFRNVTFGYEPGAPVLKNLNFTVEPGEMIGLAGHSGAGKSTLINMITAFYTADDGTVLVDDVDISQVDPKSLRSQIGVVLQDPFLFNGTIAANIAYGKPDASRQEIIAAAKAANAHEFIIRFPDGYDTQVGERGARLSGGERQRLAIARAILKDPKILILDEATASVDTETEAKIQEALERLIHGRTTFAIAHRLSTLRNANRLFILEHGEIAEMGTHDELINKPDGIYARLVNIQSELAKVKVV
ncbi:MAG TPA: ATP-binding cassette domain-containing protein [Firmicutes bacterium]|nr:ATP-binding cassette domain-containing protein [Bacillota bacterium]